MNWRARANKKFNDGKFSGNFGNKLSASGAAMSDAQDDEYLKNAGSRLDNMIFTDSGTGQDSKLTQDQMMQIMTGQLLWKKALRV